MLTLYIKYADVVLLSIIFFNKMLDMATNEFQISGPGAPLSSSFLAAINPALPHDGGRHRTQQLLAVGRRRLRGQHVRHSGSVMIICQCSQMTVISERLGFLSK